MAGINTKIPYVLERLVKGERGIVTKVEPLTVEELDDIQASTGLTFRRDDLSKLPQRVTFVNPLGETVTTITPLRKEWNYRFWGIGFETYTAREYKKYDVGSQYP